MSAERYVVAGLAHVRSPWFTDVARWATVGSLPVEFVKCVSADELRARLTTGRAFSAALVDGRLPSVDRDLLAVLRDGGVAPVVVVDPSSPTAWTDLGASAVLAAPFDRSGLLAVLVAHAAPVGTVDGRRSDPVAATAAGSWRAPLVAVTGRPGSGVSTVAAALAQALGDDPRTGGHVVLADLAHRAHQAILHDARDVVPGIQELVEAHRSTPPTADRVRSLTFDVPGRGYELLLGLRRPRDWVTIRAQAFAAALEGLRGAAGIVVAEVDHDLEGEAETGSFDIEDRNLLARRTTAEADLVVVVAAPTGTGIHGLVHQLAELRAHGVGGARLLVVVNRAPRRPRARAELTAAIAELTEAGGRGDPHVGPVYVPVRRGLEEVHRDVARFPAVVTSPLGAAVRATLDRVGPSERSTAAPEPVAIVPGSLGRWTDDGEDQGDLEVGLG